jgi:hypothetical protein
MNQHLLGGFGLYMECGACGVQVRRSPRLAHVADQLRKRSERILGYVPKSRCASQMANHRIGGQRVGWRF